MTNSKETIFNQLLSLPKETGELQPHQYMENTYGWEYESKDDVG